MRRTRAHTVTARTKGRQETSVFIARPDQRAESVPVCDQSRPDTPPMQPFPGAERTAIPFREFHQRNELDEQSPDFFLIVVRTIDNRMFTSLVIERWNARRRDIHTIRTIQR